MTKSEPLLFASVDPSIFQKETLFAQGFRVLNPSLLSSRLSFWFFSNCLLNFSESSSGEVCFLVRCGCDLFVAHFLAVREFHNHWILSCFFCFLFRRTCPCWRAQVFHAEDNQLFQLSRQSLVRSGGGETRDVFDVCLELVLLFSGQSVVFKDELKDGDCLLFKEVHVFPLFLDVLKGNCWNGSVESLFPLCHAQIEKKSNLEVKRLDGLIVWCCQNGSVLSGSHFVVAEWCCGLQELLLVFGVCCCEMERNNDFRTVFVF